ncbi:MAG: sulfotransferase domain-containing protein [Anaerolineae bacterium]|nr:MAG: sulfotransferase domain-containing protein [Anaerolineae bacterium]
MKSFRKHIITLRRRINKRKTFHPRPDDVFLVSYPRSGNTWVRFLLANLLNFPHREPVDFHTVHDIIPDLEIRAQWPHIRQMHPPRIIKSHAPYRPDFQRVIYLLRDGRDVYTSYYNYLQGQGKQPGTLAEMIRDADCLPYGAWYAHVSGWCSYAATLDFLLVRFEDLRSTPLIELQRMAAFIGLSVSKAQLHWAVEQSSLENMKRLEVERGRPYGRSTYDFVRQGRSGGWRTHFNEDCKAAFKARENNVLLELGYANTLEW